MDDPNPTTSTPIPTPDPPPAPVPPTPPPPPATPSWEQRQERQGGSGRAAGVVAGLIVLAIGLWFFADRTLGIDMPDIRWSQLWPLILIVIGLAILGSAVRRDRR